MIDLTDKIVVERWDVTVQLTPRLNDRADLIIEHSDGTAEITKAEARQIAQMLLDWANS